MKETVKSLLIGICALVALVLWLSLQPKQPADWSQKGVGEPLFPTFKDVDAMGGIDIVRPTYGIKTEDAKKEEKPDGTASIHVKRDENDWVIASASRFPANNPDRMTMVVAPLLTLSVLSEVTEIESSDEAKRSAFLRQCRLLDPTRASMSDLADAGIRVTVQGTGGETFADFIVGAIPEESSAVRDIRYLRLVGDDRVYTVDFSAEAVEASGEGKALPYVDRLSTDPLDWIDRDLLRISRWNIAKMEIFRSSIEEGEKFVPKEFLQVAQDPERSLGRVWELTERVTFDADGHGLPVEITDENRFPDNDPLNVAVDKITHLSIAGFQRKPDAFAEISLQNRPERELDAIKDLIRPFGLFLADHDPFRPEGVDPILVADGGKVRLTMTDGTVLTLLFGNATDDGKRFLVVHASFDPDFFPAPEPLVPSENADEKERERITDENRLRKSEYDLSVAEGEKKARLSDRRFAPWLYLINESDYREIFSENP